LQVTSVDELKRLLGDLGVKATQIACGDPHHASWSEGDAMPEAALASGLVLTRPERLDRLAWALDRTIALGLSDLTLHAGFLPEDGDPARRSMLDTLARAGQMASDKGVTLAFETGQESALLLRLTLDELKCPNLKVNFDPANMLLYDMGDPIHAIEILGPDIRSVHVKDARRPTIPGQWGEEVPLGQGEVDIHRFVRTLKAIGYTGPLVVEREVGDQAGRIKDVRSGLDFLKKCLSEPVDAADAVPGVHNSEQPRE
jgi:sugar phosphate isomerase/epimerase